MYAKTPVCQRGVGATVTMPEKFIADRFAERSGSKEEESPKTPWRSMYGASPRLTVKHTFIHLSQDEDQDSSHGNSSEHRATSEPPPFPPEEWQVPNTAMHEEGIQKATLGSWDSDPCCTGSDIDVPARPQAPSWMANKTKNLKKKRGDKKMPDDPSEWGGSDWKRAIAQEVEAFVAECQSGSVSHMRWGDIERSALEKSADAIFQLQAAANKVENSSEVSLQQDSIMSCKPEHVDSHLARMELIRQDPNIAPPRVVQFVPLPFNGAQRQLGTEYALRFTTEPVMFDSSGAVQLQNAESWSNNCRPTPVQQQQDWQTQDMWNRSISAPAPGHGLTPNDMSMHQRNFEIMPTACELGPKNQRPQQVPENRTLQDNGSGDAYAAEVQTGTDRKKGTPLDPMQWEKGVTTVMIRQVPRQCSQLMLLEEIKRRGFGEAFDFLYLPWDFKKCVNVGYGFVNFMETVQAKAFRDKFDGSFMDKSTGLKSCGKQLRVHPAAVQGYAANFRHFAHTKTGQKMNPQYSPLFYPERHFGDSSAGKDLQNKGDSVLPAHFGRVPENYAKTMSDIPNNAGGVQEPQQKKGSKVQKGQGKNAQQWQRQQESANAQQPPGNWMVPAAFMDGQIVQIVGAGGQQWQGCSMQPCLQNGNSSAGRGGSKKDRMELRKWASMPEQQQQQNGQQHQTWWPAAPMQCEQSQAWQAELANQYIPPGQWAGNGQQIQVAAP